jgi:hypothetical protein
MSEYVTILSLPYPQQIYIIKGRLESEGIECRIKDELTVQTNPVYSIAVGGVKLQVKEKDITEATKILVSEGYLNNNEVEENPYSEMEAFARKLPLFRKLRFEVRLIIWVFIVVTLLCIGFYLISLTGK